MSQWSFSVCSDAGLVREANEDSYCVEVDPATAAHALLAVADGMGGHAAGEVASAMAVAELVAALRAAPLDWSDPDGVLVRLGQAIEAAHSAILRAQSDPTQASMGTTLTTALVSGNDLLVGHVGDSRGYLVNGGRAVQLTNDHSVVGELLRGGVMTEAEAMQHPQRNLLTHALGAQEGCKPDLSRTTWQPGDVLLLCSDGLTNLVSSQELPAMVAETDFTTVARRLVDLANARGGNDNITVVAVRWERVNEE